MTTRKPTPLALRRALKRKLEPDVVDRHGWSDLHYAAVLNQPGLVEALLRRGANVDARLPEDDFEDETLTAFLASFGIDFGGCAGETPLHLACMVNAAQAALALVKGGADKHAALPAVSGWTPLHVAARFNAEETAFVLLLHRADMNHLDQFNAPPLHVAALYNAVDTADLLLTAGASVHIRAQDDLTSLHVAAQANSPGVAGRLLDHGADVNALTITEGVTPLDQAVAKKARSTADLLRRRGGHHTVESRLDLKTVLKTKLGEQEVLVPVLEHSWARRPRPHPMTELFSHAVLAKDLLAGFVANSEPPGWIDGFDLDNMVLVPVDWVPLEWRYADVTWSIPIRRSRGMKATHMLFVIKFADEVLADADERLGHHVSVLLRVLDRGKLYGAPKRPPLVKNLVVNLGDERWPDAPNMVRVVPGSAKPKGHGKKAR